MLISFRIHQTARFLTEGRKEVDSSSGPEDPIRLKHLSASKFSFENVKPLLYRQELNPFLPAALVLILLFFVDYVYFSMFYLHVRSAISMLL